MNRLKKTFHGQKAEIMFAFGVLLLILTSEVCTVQRKWEVLFSVCYTF